MDEKKKKKLMLKRSATNFVKAEEGEIIGQKQKQQQLEVFKETIKLDDQTQNQLQQIKEVEIGSSNEIFFAEHAQMANQEAAQLAKDEKFKKFQEEKEK